MVVNVPYRKHLNVGADPSGMRRILLRPKARRMLGVSRKPLIILDSGVHNLKVIYDRNDKIGYFIQLCKALISGIRR